MRYYRVSYTTPSDGHLGYSFHLRRRDARIDANTWESNAPSNSEAEIKAIDVDLTRHGVLRALALYAAHAENG